MIPKQLPEADELSLFVYDLVGGGALNSLTSNLDLSGVYHGGVAPYGLEFPFGFS